MATKPALLAAALATTLLLGGCTVGPNFEQPSLFSPSSWFGSRHPAPTEASRPAPEPVDAEWWTVFHDPVLTGLVRRVASSNLDVQTASVRLAQARAQRGIAGADSFPTLNYNASYTREKPSDKGAISIFSGGGGGGGSNPATMSNGLGGTQGGIPSTRGIGAFDLFQQGFDASWELDLWGRVRREVESADASVEASQESRRNTLITALAELARDYVQLRGAQRTLQITRDNLASAQESARITTERARGGLSSDLDVANAQAQAATNLSQIPQLEQQETTLINAISLLLGETPGALSAELSPPQPVPPVPPLVPVGIPSELARRRPDIRQAEAQLHAATADIGVATADFYPKISLSGSVALQALQFKDFGSWAARTYSLGPSLTLPIFEGARLTSTLELRKQQQQEAAINYQRTVLQAFHDVDNALTAYGAEQRRQKALQVAVQQNRRALGIANQRFRQGLSDYLEVLNAQRGVLAADQSYADSTTTVSTDLVQLYKALGGGWKTDFAERPAGAEAAERPSVLKRLFTP